MAENIQIDSQPAMPLPGERVTVASQARTQVSYAHLSAYAVIAFLTFLIFAGILYVQYDNDKFYTEQGMWPAAGSGAP